MLFRSVYGDNISGDLNEDNTWGLLVYDVVSNRTATYNTDSGVRPISFKLMDLIQGGTATASSSELEDIYIHLFIRQTKTESPSIFVSNS